MRSNYKRLGDFIKEVKIRNKTLEAKNLLGINIDKFFMPSVANVIGTDMSVYKIVKKNQFACNRMHVGRDYRLPVSMSISEDDFIVSPAYDVFEINDTDILYPEYLMMWFTRSEFDRNAWFYTDADVRGGLHWKALCDMQLPIPSIAKQKEIVKEYNVIQNRIALNKKLIQKLEDTAQAIYKQWFVDFEFPDENGKPYKSNGGEMVFNQELEKEIPKGWMVKRLEEITDQICVAFVGSVYEYYCDEKVGVPMLRTTDITESGVSYKHLRYVTKVFHDKNKKSQLKKGDLLVARHGSNGMPGIFDAKFEANALNVIIIKPDGKTISSKLIHCFLSSKSALEHIQGSLGGSVQDVLNTQKISDLKLAFPIDLTISINLSNKLEKIQEIIEYNRRQLDVLESLLSLLLSKLATIEN